jgi:hypothetical protein
MTRTMYMQHLMTSTYPKLALVAIQMGTLNGAWEKLIANKILLDCKNDQNPQAFDLLEATGDKEYTAETFLKAAYLVTSSETEKEIA